MNEGQGGQITSFVSSPALPVNTLAQRFAAMPLLDEKGKEHKDQSLQHSRPFSPPCLPTHTNPIYQYLGCSQLHLGNSCKSRCFLNIVRLSASTSAFQIPTTFWVKHFFLRFALNLSIPHLKSYPSNLRKGFLLLIDQTPHNFVDLLSNLLSASCAPRRTNPDCSVSPHD